MKEAFDSWFDASKYAQVVNPSDGDVQRAWDAWKAACDWRQVEIDRLQDLVAAGQALILEWTHDMIRMRQQIDACASIDWERIRIALTEQESRRAG